VIWLPIIPQNPLKTRHTTCIFFKSDVFSFFPFHQNSLPAQSSSTNDYNGLFFPIFTLSGKMHGGLFFSKIIVYFQIHAPRLILSKIIDHVATA
jgi:hypothetical protein